jgi:DnaJ family protein C protein 9
MQEILGDNCLYSLLGLPGRGTAECKKLRPEDITRAYRRRALDCHPDMNASPEATIMFQKVSAAYNVLRDPPAKERYDRDGTLDVENTGRAATTRHEDWMEVFRTLYKEVSQDEVKEFYAKYIGSEEEKEDLVKYFLGTKGDFGDMVKRHCMFPNDAPGQVTRIRNVICSLIAEGTLKENKKFTMTSTPACMAELEEYFAEERAQAEAEATSITTEAEQAASKRSTKGKGKSATDLQLAVFSNQSKFDDFLSVLEGKYSDLSKPKRQKKSR